MSAGTLKLTNGSTAVVGTSTTFNSDLTAGDVITVTVGGVFYTLFIDTVVSNTSATLTDPFTGPTTAGLSWVAVPQLTLNRITAALASQTAEAVRRILQENANWQAFYSGSGDITVTLPDGTPTGRQVTGPSWGKLKTDAGSAWIDRGTLGNAANLNTMNPAETEGEWYKSSATGLTEANGYPPGSAVGKLSVTAGGRYGGTQIYTTFNGMVFVRGLTAAWNGTDGPWDNWWPVTGYRGDAGNNSLNIYGPSYYGSISCLNSTLASFANGYPIEGSPGIGVLEIFRGGNILLHRFTSRYGRQFTRTLTGTWNGTDGPWSDWLEVGYQSPSDFVSSDMNNLVAPGQYNITTATSNIPVPVTGICRVSQRASASQVLQEYFVLSTSATYVNRVFTRTLAGGVWSGWDETIGQTQLNNQLAAFGIGAANPTISNFDWQTFNFVNGTSYQVAAASQVNVPTPIDGLNNMSLGVNVLGMSGDPSSTTAISWGLMLVSGYVNGTGSTRRMFHVIFRGTNGNRSYSVMELSAGTSPADSLSRLGGFPAAGGTLGGPLNINTAANIRATLGNLGFSQANVNAFDIPGASRSMRIVTGSAVVTTNSGSSGTVTYPAAFPSVCLAVVVCNGDRSSAGDINVIGFVTSQVSGFNFYAEGVVSAGVRVNYIAVGY